MAEEQLRTDMSLVRYSQHDNRLVLKRRHNNSVVLYDPSSQQLVIRDEPIPEIVSENCPYCHKPLRPNDSTSSTNRHDAPVETGFMTPDYFALLDSKYEASWVICVFNEANQR
jgi:hypothetical protein